MNTDNEIGAEGASALSESLKINTTLTKLDLRCEKTSRKKKQIELKKNC